MWGGTFILTKLHGLAPGGIASQGSYRSHGLLGISQPFRDSLSNRGWAEGRNLLD
jgi:hypothetical protein